jgi:hypothetical protein
MGAEVWVVVLLLIVLIGGALWYLQRLRKGQGTGGTATVNNSGFYEILNNVQGPREKTRIPGQHIDGLTLMPYERSGARDIEASGVKVFKPAPPQQQASEAQRSKPWWSIVCCNPRSAKSPYVSICANLPGNGNGLMRKPAMLKMQRSTGATRAAPRRINWSNSDKTKWAFESIPYGGSYSYAKEVEKEEVSGLIEDGKKVLKEKPEMYDGMFYQTNMTDFPKEQQKYTLVRRTGSGFKVKRDDNGKFTLIQCQYKALNPSAVIEKDKSTDKLTYSLEKLGEPVPPGRGQGVCDMPSIKIIGDIDPSDVQQGSVGDCWLLSAISALAEFDGAIMKLFEKTPGIKGMPMDASNTYVVTLYDLKTWEPVDIKVDERLCTRGEGGLLACQPSVDGELWACYLEKAIATHCGGWDAVDGGQCTHAWRLLTGCKYQYTFRDDGKGFQCFGAFNPNTSQWEELANSPHEGFQGLWPMAWPEVGGGGDLDQVLDQKVFFERMCAWDDSNFILGAGSKAGSDKQNTEGIVDGHAYTIISCIDNAGGTDFHMIKMRNPHGRGEFKAGIWKDDGPGWKMYPAVKDICKPVNADDGIFWMDSGEFFKHFKTIYLCAKDMSDFLES